MRFESRKIGYIFRIGGDVGGIDSFGVFVLIIKILFLEIVFLIYRGEFLVLSLYLVIFIIDWSRGGYLF